MSNKTLTIEELAAIYMAGGRNRKEKSNARPKREYYDPADHVEFPAEIERQKKLNLGKKKGRKK